MNNKTISCGCTATKEALTPCPTCNVKGNKVNETTLKKHLKKEYYPEIKSNKDSFNFCSTPNCGTVYYSNESDETFTQKTVKHKVAAKNQDLDTPLCYCKRFTKQDAIDVIESGEKDVVGTILDAIGDNCKCSKTNHKGVSCVEDIANFLTPYGIEFSTSKSSCSADESSLQFTTSVKEKKTSCC